MTNDRQLAILVRQSWGNFQAKESGMDFIERWLGMSPDGGTGSTELLYLAAAVLLAATALGRWFAKRQPTKTR